MMRMLINERCITENNKDLFKRYVDFEKAFDRIHWETIKDITKRLVVN